MIVAVAVAVAVIVIVIVIIPSEETTTRPMLFAPTAPLLIFYSSLAVIVADLEGQ